LLYSRWEYSRVNRKRLPRLLAAAGNAADWGQQELLLFESKDG
jgi:hypothetical protein